MATPLETLAKMNPNERRALLEEMVYKYFAPKMVACIYSFAEEVKEGTLQNVQLSVVAERPSLMHYTFKVDIAKPTHELYKNLCVLLDAHE